MPHHLILVFLFHLKDQLATGLIGMRSPYGQPASVFSPNYVSGGSSSGSCVSVASNQVSFSLATDTAGSGRVPAAFNNIIGFKPTRGTVSLHVHGRPNSETYVFARYLQPVLSLVA